jgi:general secretion pathway protein B
MSYILDALRRAESERERGSLPGLNTHAGAQVLVDRRLLGRGNPWLWLLAGMVAAVLLSVGVRLWWGWATADVLVEPQQTATQNALALSAPPAPLVLGTPPMAGGSPAVTSPRVAAPEIVVNAPARVELRPAPASTAVPIVVPIAASNALVRAPAGTSSAALAASTAAPPVAPPDGRIHAPDELPAEIRSELPNLAFGGLIQLEDPPRRSLIINDVIYMEGDLIQPNLVLEQIRPNAAVLRYKGHRYQLPI